VETDIQYVLDKLRWMREQKIWPNGRRYLWTDAFGVVLLVSLHRHLGEQCYLDEAERLVGEVDRILGRARGIRIGEAPDRDGQYFHYLAKWLFALGRLGTLRTSYRDRAIAIARDIHRTFVIPGVGVIWKMKEDLSGPYPGFGLGALDAFDGYVVYRLLGEQELAFEIDEMRELVNAGGPGICKSLFSYSHAQRRRTTIADYCKTDRRPWAKCPINGHWKQTRDGIGLSCGRSDATPLHQLASPCKFGEHHPAGQRSPS
jgi:hypothetical protein